MAEVKIPLLFAPNSYWLCKDSILGGKSIALYINGQKQQNIFRCDTPNQYEGLITELKSISSLLNSTPSTDVISASEIEMSESEKFVNFRYALNGFLSFSNYYPHLIIESSHDFPGYKMPVKINGDTLICSHAKFNFSNCQLDVEGRVKDSNEFHSEFMFVPREYKEIIRKLLRASYLSRIEWVSRSMNFSPMINEQTIITGIRNGFLRRL